MGFVISRSGVRVTPTSSIERHPCFELFYRNTGGFLPENLVLSRFSGFCVLEGGLSEHEKREDVFFHQSRYMNTTFRYNFLHVRLQMLAASYNPAFDGGEPHCKIEYILLHTFGSVVLKCIPVDMLLPF